MCIVADNKYVPLIENSEGEFIKIYGTVFQSLAQANSVAQALGFNPISYSWEGQSEIIYLNYVTGTLLVLEELHG